MDRTIKPPQVSRIGTDAEFEDVERKLEKEIHENTLQEVSLATNPSESDALGHNYAGSTTIENFVVNPNIDVSSQNSHQEFAKRIMGYSGNMRHRSAGIEVQPVNGWIGIRGGPACVPVMGKLGQITSYTQKDACHWNPRPYMGSSKVIPESAYTQPTDTTALDTLLSI